MRAEWFEGLFERELRKYESAKEEMEGNGREVEGVLEEIRVRPHLFPHWSLVWQRRKGVIEADLFSTGWARRNRFRTKLSSLLDERRRRSRRGRTLSKIWISRIIGTGRLFRT